MEERAGERRAGEQGVASESTRWVIRVSLWAASFFLVRGYAALDSFIWLPKYCAGMEQMPFQGRMLMMFPLRWAEGSARLQHWTHGRDGFKTPDVVVITLVGIVSVILTGVLVTALYRRTTKSGRLVYLPYAVMLVAAAISYQVQNFSFPYDLPSMAFFTLGVYFIYSRKFWALLVLFPIATFNRETTLFLIPLLALDGLVEEDGVDWGRLFGGWLMAKLVALSAIWVAIEVYVHHRFRGNPVEASSALKLNLHWLAHPQYWPMMLSSCAFLLPVILLLQGRIEDRRFRVYLWTLPVWIVFMVVYGHLLEVRIFGELSGVVGLAATLILESSLGLKPVAAEI